MKKFYPSWNYKSNRLWLRNVRRRWVKLRSALNCYDTGIRAGSAYYPPEVYKWLSEFEKMDAKMREYYKNA